MKKLIAAVLVLVMFLQIGAISVSAETISGICGENAKYTLDKESGVLTISGSGEMEDYSLTAPWYYYASSVKSVAIENGITKIGETAFIYCINLTDVQIPDSVTVIGNAAF